MKHLFQIGFFFALCSVEYLALTTRDIEPVTNSWDKLNHAAAFCVLYILFSLGFSKPNIKLKVLFLMLFAFQIEFAQYFIPGRFLSFMDILADITGVAAGIVICRYTAFGIKGTTL